MPVLPASEYDASYFDGAEQVLAHNAGYSRYARWGDVRDDNRMSDGRVSTGEYWRDKAIEIANRWLLPNQKVLEIGCAKGFIVEDLVDMGVDAYGLDVSDWALNSCPGSARTDAAATIRRPDLASRFYLGDVRTALAQFKRNEFDVVFSLRFMECMDDADLPGLISELNRICRGTQVHVIDEFSSGQIATFYNAKPIGDWLAMGWDAGTRLIANERPNDVVVKS